MAVRLEFNRRAVNALRSSPAMKSLLEAEGRKVLNAAQRSFTPTGSTDRPGYHMVVDRYPSGYRVGVAPHSTHAKRHDAKYNTLLRSLGSR